MFALSTFLGKIAYAKQMCSRLKYIFDIDFVNYFFSQIANFKQCPACKKTNLRNILLRIANLLKYFWQCCFMSLIECWVEEGFPFSSCFATFIKGIHLLLSLTLWLTMWVTKVEFMWKYQATKPFKSQMSWYKSFRYLL